MKPGDIIYIGQHPVRINKHSNGNIFWFTYLENDLVNELPESNIKQINKKEFKIEHLGKYAKELQMKYSAIHISNANYIDCPEIEGEESFSYFIEILKMKILTNKINETRL